MADPRVFELAKTITCHAWNADRSMLAICPNTPGIIIYSGCHQPDPKRWKKEYELEQHDLVVSALDWSATTNKIVSCSHDRNAFVWTFGTDSLSGKGQWTPTLVILRINRAATDVKWSHDGRKFAVASCAKCVPVCHYEERNNWWISKMIKKHKSTVTSLDWHPNNQLLVTGSTDFKCRVFSAFIDAVDEVAYAAPFPEAAPFGQLLAEFDIASSWVNSVAWSPGGYQLAFAGHNSTVNFVLFNEDPSYPPEMLTVRLAGLPLTKIMFLAEDSLVGIGFDFSPMIFTCSETGWTFASQLDVKKEAPTRGPAKGSGFGAARAMFESKVSRGTTGRRVGDSGKDALFTKHENTITDIFPFEYSETAVTMFSTSGLDGRIVVWDMKSLSGSLAALRLS
eukprot:PLAT4195.1.p2 GENE.PLAT4195.1~~PLAT4195.1.p2  ORF type:complete len:395 (+),score=187.91 PLAT4195.1:83-1267(+)